MRILVACEESQTVCKAFRGRGHEAYSADIKEPSGGRPEWHILGDVLPLINGNYRKFQGRKERDQKIRSKTFSGIAAAMAEQWGCLYD